MKRILITGANGLLGQKLIHLYRKNPNVALLATAIGSCRINTSEGYEYCEIDITNRKQVFDVFDEFKPETVINTAAMTNVDACETEPDKCRMINVTAVEYLTQACVTHNSHFIHLSTDFVFDGLDGPYSEEDKPNPLSFYAQSKLDSENIVVNSGLKKWAIARTIIIYGLVDDMSRSNVVLWAKGALEKGQPINVVNDQFRSPTLAEDLALGCALIEEKEATGIYHLSGPETHSIIDFVYMVADFYKLDKSLINPVSTETLNQPAKRPPKTGFDISKARNQLGYNPRTFIEGMIVLDNQLTAK